MSDIAADWSDYVLAALYQRAHTQDMEYTACGYWQALMQKNFRLQDGYAVLCEQSPDDDDRTRIDQIIFRLNPDMLLAKVCMVEGKRRGAGYAHIKEAERQALHGARKAIERDELPVVYAMTHWRTHFRVWKVTPGGGGLEPLDGREAKPGDRDSYLEIATKDGGEVFNHFIELVKGSDDQPQGNPQPGPPDEQAPYPQQPPQLYDCETAGPSGWPREETIEPTDEQFEGYEYEAAAESSAGVSQGKAWLEVQVTLEKHRAHGDRWVFTAGGSKQKINVSNWERATTVDGAKVYVYHGKKTTYFTRQKPSR
ncbi:hypothetical protein B0J18DRAFT_302890 [Chaetomium sp. MPI-SDFR-AT-0129]|nr:hypothetical protein B0J18DRAFT_302890 [Chaetomium sp. MPI-SDFR-AT-0129]